MLGSGNPLRNINGQSQNLWQTNSGPRLPPKKGVLGESHQEALPQGQSGRQQLWDSFKTVQPASRKSLSPLIRDQGDPCSVHVPVTKPLGWFSKFFLSEGGFFSCWVSAGSVWPSGDLCPSTVEITAFLVKAFPLFFIWPVVSGKGLLQSEIVSSLYVAGGTLQKNKRNACSVTRSQWRSSVAHRGCGACVW